MTMRESGDELWDEFVREFEKNNAVREPSAAERARQAEQAKPRRSRRLVLPVAAALLVAAGATAYVLRPSDRSPAAAPAPAPATTAASTPSEHAAAAPAGAPASAIPLSVFPAQVQGYTLVAKVANPSCTGSDTVAPTLAGLITQGHGCFGVDLALYKDAEGNQYDLALFAMKDPLECVHLINVLASSPESYQVAVQVPPKDSGLRQLPSDSGLVQNFASYGHGMLVGMAQWSDGRTADFGALSDRLSPLTGAVIRNVPV
ncbi:hypothetical protein AB0C76_24415 [Kitasatospora sp. NPDC048722]|uniref:hypothetical protein n=1 Tax=Kitasatospora sp. NPDC048722 TaxID=3155639 RepID=UPI0033EE3F52